MGSREAPKGLHFYGLRPAGVQFVEPTSICGIGVYFFRANLEERSDEWFRVKCGVPKARRASLLCTEVPVGTVVQRTIQLVRDMVKESERNDAVRLYTERSDVYSRTGIPRKDVLLKEGERT